MQAPLASPSEHTCSCSRLPPRLLARRQGVAAAPPAARRRRCAALERRHRADRIVCSAETVEASPDEASTSGVDRSGPAAAAEPALQAPKARTWELDFSSRPILDARGKKRWELLICDSDRAWTYSKYFPNNKINSTQARAPAAGLLGMLCAVQYMPCQVLCWCTLRCAGSAGVRHGNSVRRHPPLSTSRHHRSNRLLCGACSCGWR